MIRPTARALEAALLLALLAGCPGPAEPPTAPATDADPGPAAPLCSFDELSPAATTDPARPTMPWRFEPGPETPASASLARCRFPTSTKDQIESTRSCRGQAKVVRAGSDVTLTFADGGLTWQPHPLAPAVAPPALADGALVFIDYLDERYRVCPFCGGYQAHELEIRTQEGGKLLWLGREGQRQNDLDQATVMALFGVTARTQLACQQRHEAGCYDVQRWQFDHVLATSPEQLVRHARVTRVTTPNGQYDVLWTRSDDEPTRRQNCADGGDAAHDTGFAASLIP